MKKVHNKTFRTSKVFSLLAVILERVPSVFLAVLCIFDRFLLSRRSKWTCIVRCVRFSGFFFDNIFLQDKAASVQSKGEIHEEKKIIGIITKNNSCKETKCKIFLFPLNKKTLSLISKNYYYFPFDFHLSH